MFKALYNHVNNIIEKYLQIYYHILIYLQWIKKEKLKLKQLLNHIHNDKKKKRFLVFFCPFHLARKGTRRKASPNVCCLTQSWLR